MTLPRNVSDALANQTDPPVPIGPVVPGTGATDLGKAEDSPSTSGATGVAMLGVRNDADAVLTDADLDYSFVATDSAGRLKSVSSVPTPVSAAFDFSAAAQTAVLSLANGNTAVAIQVDSMGNGGGLQVDVTADGVSWQQLTVTPVAEGLATLAPAITIIIAANYQAAAAGFAQVRIRCSAFTGPGHLTGTIRAANGEGLNGARPTTICSAAGSPFVNPTNGFNEPAPTNMSVGLTAQLDDVVPTPIAENSWGNLRMSPERSLYSEIRDAAGNERGANVTAAGALQVDGSAATQPVSGTVAVSSVVAGTGATNLGKAEDAPASSGDVGVMALAVRNDADVDRTNNDGDYSGISVDSTGRPKIGQVVPGTADSNLGKGEGETWSPACVGVLGMAHCTEDDTTRALTSDENYNLNVNVKTGIIGGIVAVSSIAVGEVAASLGIGYRADTFTATGNGTIITTNGLTPYKYFSLQVLALGAVTSWTVVLEISLDAVNLPFTTLITATSVADNGKLLSNPTTQPCAPTVAFRCRCSAIVLGGGVSITATILGMN